VELTPQARRDLRRIWCWLRDEAGVERADALIASLQAVAHHLADYPQLGRTKNDFGPGVRVLSRRPYLLFYREKDERIEVLRIIDGRRDVPAAWRESE